MTARYFLQTGRKLPEAPLSCHPNLQFLSDADHWDLQRSSSWDITTLLGQQAREWLLVGTAFTSSKTVSARWAKVKPDTRTLGVLKPTKENGDKTKLQAIELRQYILTANI